MTTRKEETRKMGTRFESLGSPKWTGSSKIRMGLFLPSSWSDVDLWIRKWYLD